jgi:predicted PurR-regulated permease PerM
LRGRTSAAAILTVAATVITVIVPLLLFLGVLVHEATQVSRSLESWISDYASRTGDLQQTLEESPWLARLLPYQDQIIEKAGQLAGQAASYVAQNVVALTQGTAQFFLMLFVSLYAMFYFLKDGRKILDWMFAYTPLSASDRQQLLTTFGSVSRATLKSTLVIGVVQGGLAGAAFAVAGIGGAVFWAAIMALLSILPGVGTALVWVPAVFYLAVIGRYEAAIGLALWCALVVGTADNLLRPLLIGKDTEMPDLMIFLTTLGGIFLFGAAGIVIGPVVGALFLTIWELWGSAVEKSAPAALPKSTDHE